MISGLGVNTVQLVIALSWIKPEVVAEQALAWGF
jgi:hypothetical protein